MTTHERLPWVQLMELALGVLRMEAETFWRMTPTELTTIIRAQRRAGLLTELELPAKAGDLQELMQRFPD